MRKNFWHSLPRPILALAPMAGVTDYGLRHLCRGLGADVVYTEMISIDALYYESAKTLAMLHTGPKERPVVLQLFGKRPELATKAVKIVEEHGFSGIDINFGCPARKVVRHGGGISLLKDLNLCHELVQAVCEVAKVPVSVKTRVSIGEGKKKVTVFDFLEKIKDLPVAALMLHGRTYEQGFSGDIDYAIMAATREIFPGVILGNGGLNTPEDVALLLEKTGLDGAGIARGIYGRPWIFQQLKDYWRTGKYREPTIKEIKKIALAHAKFNFKDKDKRGIIEMRKHLCWYFRGLPDAAKLRAGFVQVETLQEIKEQLKRIEC